MPSAHYCFEEVKHSPRKVAVHLLLVAFVVLSACSKPDPTAPLRSPESRNPIVRTALTSRLRNDFEYHPLQPGKPGSMQIRITDLLDGSLVEKAEVRVTIRRRGAGKAVTQSIAESSERGTYVAELTVAEAGEYDVEFTVQSAALDERFPLSDFEVE
jgi:hypothetical protein